MSLNIVCHGNSITAGSGVTAPEKYPAQLGVLRPSDTVINAGQSGKTTSELLAAFAEQVQTHYDNTEGVTNIVVFWESTNAFYFDETLNGEIADVITYCNTAATNGWKVILLNIVQRGTSTTTMEIWRDRASSMNEWYLANGDVYAERIYNIDNVHIDLSTPFTGGAFPVASYVDAAHLTGARLSDVAEVVDELLDKINICVIPTNIDNTRHYVYAAYNGNVFRDNTSGDYYRGVSGGDAISVPAIGLTAYAQ